MNEANALKNSETNDTDDNRTIEPLWNLNTFYTKIFNLNNNTTSIDFRTMDFPFYFSDFCLFSI